MPPKLLGQFYLDLQATVRVIFTVFSPVIQENIRFNETVERLNNTGAAGQPVNMCYC